VLEIAGSLPCPIEIRPTIPRAAPAFLRPRHPRREERSLAGLAQQRLKAVGQRPISALVDMTNYIMLSYGRPLHVYDLARLQGASSPARLRDGEQVQALNGKTYSLDPTMTVIADDAHVHDIGGIMGGEESGVQEGTTDILIECAYFDPGAIARTGQKLGLTSDARTRFERGVDPAFSTRGLALATAMALELAGGRHPKSSARARRRSSIAWSPTHHRARSRWPASTCPSPNSAGILERLGFSVESGETWQVRPPSWRRDVDGAADIVEEVVRIHGIAHVPRRRSPARPAWRHRTATPEQLVERRVRRTGRVARPCRGGDLELRFEAEAAPFGGSEWVLANPISEELKVMRPSLLPGLLAAARRNIARGADIVACSSSAPLPRDAERPTVGLLLAGDRTPRHWRTGRAQPFDASTPKAEAIASRRRGAKVDNLQTLGARPRVYHPGARRGSASAPRTCWPSSANCTRRRSRRSTCRPVIAAEIFLDAIPARRGTSRTPRSLCPAAAAGREARLRLPCACRDVGRCPCSGGCAAPTRPRLRR
jgi:phenylalanyl-tRNA synthetase beta chain